MTTKNRFDVELTGARVAVAVEARIDLSHAVDRLRELLTTLDPDDVTDVTGALAALDRAVIDVSKLIANLISV